MTSFPLSAAAASPPYKIPSNVPRCQISISGLDSAWYLHRQVQAQASSAGGTVGQMSSKRGVFSEGATFDMQITVGTVAVCSFLPDPVLLLLPARLHPRQCQLCIGSQQLPAISWGFFCFGLFCSKAHASLCAMVISHSLLVLGRLCFSSCRREL